MTTTLRTMYTVELAAMTCPVKGCGVTYGLNEPTRLARQQDHGNWYCTNGHVLRYPSKSDAEIARDERDAARSLAHREAVRRRETESRLQRAERRRAAAVGQTTKLKNRIGNGVCPCCNRTFVDLARHMAGQHPNFTGDAS